MTHKTQTRRAKVYYAFYKTIWKYCQYPVIRIGGKYLASFGFQIGSKLQISIKHDEIIIKRIP